MTEQIDIHVKLDAGAFRRYCAFDAFRRRRRWFAPLLAALLLVSLSLSGLTGVIALSPGASGLLMGLGLAVPMLAFGLYFIQIEAQIARQQLKGAPAVYSLRLSPEGVRVTNDRRREDPVDLPWDRLWAAFRRRDCVYLYVNPERALILPDGQASSPPDELWRFLRRRLGEARCVERR